MALKLLSKLRNQNLQITRYRNHHRLLAATRLFSDRPVLNLLTTNDSKFIIKNKPQTTTSSLKQHELAKFAAISDTWLVTPSLKAFCDSINIKMLSSFCSIIYWAGGIQKVHLNHCMSWTLHESLSFAPRFVDISGRFTAAEWIIIISWVFIPVLFLIFLFVLLASVRIQTALGLLKDLKLLMLVVVVEFFRR